MFFNRKNKKAQSFAEYAMLLLVVLGAFLIFRVYLLDAICGRWKSVGDSLGSGRLFNPVSTSAMAKTKECVFEYRFNSGLWYDQDCYKTNNCFDVCETTFATAATCLPCVQLCDDAVCMAPELSPGI